MVAEEPAEYTAEPDDFEEMPFWLGIELTEIRMSVLDPVIQLPLINDDVIYEPAYTVAQAARLARMSPVTVRHWLIDYRYANREMKPVFGLPPKIQEDDLEPMISFVQLAELVVAKRLRQGEAALDIAGQVRAPMPLKRIRAAHEYARKVMGVDYPFAHLHLQDQGGHTMHEFEEQAKGGPKGYLALDAGGNWMLPDVVEKELRHFHHQQDDMAAEWYPLGDDEPIRLNPRIRGGQPTLVKIGITVATIVRRIERGERREIVAYDYGIDLPTVEAAMTAARRYAAA